MNKLLIGTTNRGKLKEIKSIIKGKRIKIVSLRDIKNPPEVKETGKTYLANALKKACVLTKFTGLPVLAEDSGLEVKALGNKPGIYSARFGGARTTPEKNNQKLLKELQGVPLSKRNAMYRCVAVIIIPECKMQNAKCKIKVAEGICKGRIAFAPSGKNGFGYDPLFIPTGFRKTFGELSKSIKNRISHRTKAIKKLMKMV
jgi:XTP/dITP diphosphohydrolase